MLGFENRVTVPDLIGDEKRKHKIPPFADQKTRIDDTPSVNTKLEAEPFK